MDLRRSVWQSRQSSGGCFQMQSEKCKVSEREERLCTEHTRVAKSLQSKKKQKKNTISWTTTIHVKKWIRFFLKRMNTRHQIQGIVTSPSVIWIFGVETPHALSSLCWGHAQSECPCFLGIISWREGCFAPRKQSGRIERESPNLIGELRLPVAREQTLPSSSSVEAHELTSLQLRAGVTDLNKPDQ